MASVGLIYSIKLLYKQTHSPIYITYIVLALLLRPVVIGLCSGRPELGYIHASEYINFSLYDYIASENKTLLHE